jgi:hypothetical protein
MNNHYSIIWRGSNGAFNYIETDLTNGTKSYVDLIRDGAKSIRFVCEGRVVREYPAPVKKGFVVTTKEAA